MLVNIPYMEHIYIYVYIHSFIRIYIYVYIYGLNLTIQQPRPFVNDSPDPNCTNPIMAGFEADSHPDVSHSTGLSYHTFSSFPTNAA